MPKYTFDMRNRFVQVTGGKQMIIWSPLTKYWQVKTAEAHLRKQSKQTEIAEKWLAWLESTA